MKDYHYLLLFIIFCLWMAFPITHFNCDKTTDMCTCKQYIPINLDFYRFKEHALSDIKYAVSFRTHGYSGGIGGKYIGFRYKTSDKLAFMGAIVDERFLYDILTPPANDFVEEFNQYLNNDKKTFNKIHIPPLFITGLVAIFMILILFSFKNRNM